MYILLLNISGYIPPCHVSEKCLNHQQPPSIPKKQGVRIPTADAEATSNPAGPKMDTARNFSLRYFGACEKNMSLFKHHKTQMNYHHFEPLICDVYL